LPNIPVDLLSHALLPLVDLALLHPHLFMPTLSHTLPYLLTLLSPPASGLSAYPFSPYPPTSMACSDWEEVANPATEIILTLAELRGAQITAWEEGRVGRELVGLLIGRLVGGLEDLGDECKEWLEEINVGPQS